jgi:hypothetical protein
MGATTQAAVRPLPGMASERPIIAALVDPIEACEALDSRPLTSSRRVEPTDDCGVQRMR